MNQVIPIFKREFSGYFRSPVGYVFLAVFTLLAAVLLFFGSEFLKGDDASLGPLFQWIPWIFVFLVPAAGMRLWSEERRSGTIELLFTLPVSTTEAVIGKFLAAWAFIACGVALTFPFAMTVGYLGNPDWGVIFAGYAGTILMAASYLGICSLTSALTRNQVISFVLSAVICFCLALAGFGKFSELLKSWNLPVSVVDAVANFSFYPHFSAITRGIVDLPSLVFFVSIAVFSLVLNVIVLER